MAGLDTGSEPPWALTFVGDGSVLVGVIGQELRAWTLSQDSTARRLGGS